MPRPRKVEAIVSPLLESGVAERVFAVAGMRGQGHRAFVVVRLADWDAARADPAGADERAVRRS